MSMPAIRRIVASLLALAITSSFTEASSTVCALSQDGSKVLRWDHSGRKWDKIGDEAGAIYGGGGEGLVATTTKNTEVHRYYPDSKKWEKLGGGGAKFVMTTRSIYGLSANRDAVYKWERGTEWTKIGGRAKDIYGGGEDSLFATTEHNTEVWYYISGDKWEKVGGGGADFAVDGFGQLYGLSSAKDQVSIWTGLAENWAKIGDKTSKIVAGGFGMFGVSDGNREIWAWSSCTGNEWKKVGDGGQDFAVSNEALYGLDGYGSKVFRWEDGQPWKELEGAGRVKQIVPC